MVFLENIRPRGEAHHSQEESAEIENKKNRGMIRDITRSAEPHHNVDNTTEPEDTGMIDDITQGADAHIDANNTTEIDDSVTLQKSFDAL